MRDPADRGVYVAAGITEILSTPRGASTFEAGMTVLLVSACDDLASVIDLFRRR
jgi:hypothetical protein